MRPNIAFLASLFLCTSCMLLQNYSPLSEQDKTPVNFSYNFSDFSSIDVSCAFEVELIQGEYSVELTVPKKLEERLVVYSKNSELHITYRDSFFDNNFSGLRSKAVISLPYIKEIELSGASSLKSSGLDCTKLEIDCSGASHMDISGTFSEVDVDCNGASTVKIVGIAPLLNVDLSGASTLKAFGLESWDADLELSGASKAEVSVARSLKTECSGASMVYYKASGDVLLWKNCSGASEVIKR